MLALFEKKVRARLRLEWESPNPWLREFDSIRCLFDLTRPTDLLDVIDEKTWIDLNMDSVFRRIDSTQTSLGQQVLYLKMRLLQAPGERLENEYRVISILRENQQLREDLQLCLSVIKEGDAKTVSQMLFGNFPIVHFWRLGVLLWSLISISTLIFAVLSGGIFLILPPVIITLNFVLSRYFENATDRITYVFFHLSNLVTAAAAIAKLKTSEKILEHRELKKNVGLIRKVRSTLKQLSINQNHENAIVSNALFLVNLVFPVDLIVYSFSIEKITNYQDFLQECYRNVGAIDAKIAVACYTHRHPSICNPEFNAQREIELVDFYHPLIENCITNTFSSHDSSALVTGSNMAGKTTFIKSIGVNVILARTFWFCHGAKARLPAFNVLSSIKTEDDLEQGKSFYFSELERLNRFLKLSEEGQRCLILIDEIYRGTNTVERIAGAAAVLHELAKNNIVLVTTHDIELADFLQEQYSLWYFEQSGSKSQPFDYKLRSGVCMTRNAIELMRNMGYPEHITEHALDLTAQFDDPMGSQK